MDYPGVGSLGWAIPATCLVVRAGENPQAWISIPDDKTSTQTVADLESLSWVLLDDLACSLTEDAFVPVQSILLYQPDKSSNVVVYVSFEDPDSTLNTLTLDHTLDYFLYTDITGVSDLGLGNSSGAALSPSENLSSDPHLDGSTLVGSETDLWASNDDLAINSNLAVDSASDPLTPTSSSLDLDSALAGNALDSPFDVDVASNLNDLNGLGVSGCS